MAHLRMWAGLVLLFLIVSARVHSAAQSPTPRSVEGMSALAPLLDTTGFQGTVLIYDLRHDRFQAIHPEGVDTRHIPASTFKIVNALVALEAGIVRDARSVIPWDSVVRSRRELNRDLDLASAFRLSAVPHFQWLARAAGMTIMQRFVDSIGYGNRDLFGGIDQFWLTGNLRVSPREQIELLVRLYRSTLPFSASTMKTVRDIMEVERTPSTVLRAKTGWAIMSDGHEVGWWVGWVEHDSNATFFASVIEADRPGPRFGPARTEIPRAVLRRLGILPPPA